MPITGSATASRKRTAHFHDCQFAAAPDHRGRAALADGFDAEDLRASIAAAPSRCERHGCGFAPGAQPVGDVLAIGGEHSPGSPRPRVGPCRSHRLRRPGGAETFFMRDEEDRFSGAPQPSKASAAFRVRAHPGWPAFRRIGPWAPRRSGRPYPCGEFARPRRGGGVDLCRAVLADHADNHAIGHFSFEIAQRLRGHLAKREGHKSTLPCPSAQLVALSSTVRAQQGFGFALFGGEEADHAIARREIEAGEALGDSQPLRPTICAACRLERSPLADQETAMTRRSALRYKSS